MKKRGDFVEGMQELFDGGSKSISIFGLFSVSEYIVVSWGIILFLAIGSMLLTRNLQKKPGKVQAFLEVCIGFFNDFCKQNLGSRWRVFAPWLGTIALFVTACNLIPLLGITPPTKSLSIVATLSVLSAVLMYSAQFRYLGFKKGLKKFASPTILLLPINLLEIFIRPLSLCMRLFGNVLASYIVMEMIHAVVPVIIPVVFQLYFDIFDGLIQSVVFVFLTTLFLSEGMEKAH